MRSPTLLRRFGAALSMAFLLDLGGQASAAVCATGASRAMDAHQHAGMMRSGVAHAARSEIGPSRDGCELPVTSPDCATMTTCASLTAVVTVPLVALRTATPSFEPTQPALPHSGPATAPEPPPPRG
jgi:hypothetical protein